MTKMTYKLIKLQLKLKKETTKLPKVKEEYPQFDEVSMWQSCGKTLLLLLSKVSPSLNKTLCAGLIGNIITTAVTSHPSMLQIALGLLGREKKIQQLYSFGTSASYNEIRRYKISAAANRNFLEVKLNSNQELIQDVCDNYDTKVTSLNGLKTTNSLATIITQSINNNFTDPKPAVP